MTFSQRYTISLPIAFNNTPYPDISKADSKKHQHLVYYLSRVYIHRNPETSAIENLSSVWGDLQLNGHYFNCPPNAVAEAYFWENYWAAKMIFHRKISGSFSQEIFVNWKKARLEFEKLRYV
jgi:hypothetical protein